MVGAVHATDQDWHILALYADAGDQESLADSLEALMALRPDRSEGRAGKWFMRAYPPEQRELVVGREAEALHAPGWWPRDDARAFSELTES